MGRKARRALSIQACPIDEEKKIKSGKEKTVYSTDSHVFHLFRWNAIMQKFHLGAHSMY